MTLSEINRRINGARAAEPGNPDSALLQNEQLFVALAQQGEVFVVSAEHVSDEDLAAKRIIPFAAPAQEGDARSFIRIFSHRDVALAFVEAHGLEQIVGLDGVELMQLAKTSFLRGHYGFLLNDGVVWTAISLPDFLSACFRDIFGDMSSVRAEYIGLVEFLNLMRRDEQQIVVARQIVRDASEMERVFFLDAERASGFSGAEYTVEPVSLERVMQMVTAKEPFSVFIRTATLDLRVSSDLLRAAMRATGLTDETPADPQNFYTQSIVLDFCPSDYEGIDPSFLPPVQLVELPEMPKQKKPKKQRKDSPRAKWKGLFAKKKSKREEPEYRGPEGAPSSSEPPASEPEKKPFLKGIFRAEAFSGLPMKVVVWSCAAIVFLLVATTTIIFFVAPTPVEAVETDIETGAYDVLPEDYHNCVSRRPGHEEYLVELMTADLYKKLSAYAMDTLSSADLAAAINSYKKIEPMTTLADAAYRKAALLEQSKIAFQNGVSASSVFTKLTYWRSVIEDDTGSKSKMAEILTTQKESLKEAAFKETLSRSENTALSNLYLLQTYYPDDEDIIARISLLQESAFAAGSGGGGSTLAAAIQTLNIQPTWSAAPIMIYKTQPKQVGYEGWTNLSIEWVNRSEKAISCVVFEVVPYDFLGNRLTTTAEVDGSGLYSKYQAKFNGPFAPGAVVEGYSFPKAWCNPNIAVVAVELVVITYEDGTITTIYDPEEIAGMYPAN